MTHFVVEGPGRECDMTTFCESCWAQALEWSAEWMEQQADDAQVGERVTVSITIASGEPENCYGIHKEKEDSDD